MSVLKGKLLQYCYKILCLYILVQYVFILRLYLTGKVQATALRIPMI